MIRKIIIAAITMVPFYPFCMGTIYAENGEAIIQQDRKGISGLVVDGSGAPLIGVNIGVKGTHNGTITDVDGKFNLENPSNSVLVVSYIGYKTVEIPAKNNLRI